MAPGSTQLYTYRGGCGGTGGVRERVDEVKLDRQAIAQMDEVSMSLLHTIV